MPSRSTDTLLCHLRRAVFLREAHGLTDAELLAAFLEFREEAAFAALVHRHGPMVLGVCRRVLGDRHDAEDAFQATFLVLLRKASSIRPRQAVGPWLHGVAYRTALRARAVRQRRRWKEGQAQQLRPHQRPEGEGEWRMLLDEELNRLPEKYRVAIVLCDLQGRTQREAARQLGWPQGTLSGRLWRGRQLLARRLTRRGLTLSVSVLALACAEDAAFAGLAAPLVESTRKIAGSWMQAGTAAGEVPANVAALSQGVVKAMKTTGARMMAMLLAASLPVGVCLYAVGAQERPKAGAEPAAPPAAAPANAPPTAQQLIEHHNANARRVEGLRCRVTLDWHSQGMSVGLGGSLACERLRHVRLSAKVLGQPALDLGCNDEEYWCWLSNRQPPDPWRVLRSEEGRRDRINWPSPCRPEWLLDMLGIAAYDPAKSYAVRTTEGSIELTEAVRSPRDEWLHKESVWHRKGDRAGQLTAVVLRTALGETVCRAEIKRMHTDPKTGARISQDISLVFPREKVDVRIQLSDFKVEEFSAEHAAVLFSPKNAPFSPKAGDIARKEKAPEPPRSVRIDLSRDRMEMEVRRGEEVLKISGRTDGPLALQALRDQLRGWSEKDKRGTLLIRCDPAVEDAVLKSVLDACRLAGARIELKAE